MRGDWAARPHVFREGFQALDAGIGRRRVPAGQYDLLQAALIPGLSLAERRRSGRYSYQTYVLQKRHRYR